MSLKASLRLFNQLGNKWYMLGGLVVLAGIACKRGQLETAAKFIGVHNKGLESINGAIPPWFLAEVYNPILKLIRSQMDHSVYLKAWNEGYSLTKEQALYFVLEVANE